MQAWDLIVTKLSLSIFGLIRKASAPYFRNYRLTIFLIPSITRDQAYEVSGAVDIAVKSLGSSAEFAALNPTAKKLMCLPDLEDWKKSRNRAVRIAANVANNLGWEDSSLKLDRLSGTLYLLVSPVVVLGTHRRDTDAWVWQSIAPTSLNSDMDRLDAAYAQAALS